MSRIVSSASTTRAHSRQRSSQPSFVQTSLAVAMFSALTSISFAASALTMDQASKTVTVDEDYTPTVVRDYGSSTVQNPHARLFSNVVLGESAGSSSTSPAESQADASGFTLNIQNNVTYPQGATDMYGPIGAARIEHSGSSIGTANDNTVNLSGNVELLAARADQGVELFGGYIRIADRTNAETMTGNLTANNNRIVIGDGVRSNRMGDLIAGYVYNQDLGKPGAQTGSMKATVTGNEVVINGGTLQFGQGYLAGGYASLASKNAVDVTVLAENNSVTINNVNQTSEKGSTNGLYGAFLSGTSDNGNGTGTVTLTARNNRITIAGGTIGGFSNGIAGARFVGYSAADSSYKDIVAENNSITIKDGSVLTLSNVYGVHAARGMRSTTLTNNTVTIEGGDFSPSSGTSFMGSYTPSYTTASTGTIEATGNKVIVLGGTGNSINLYGGRLDSKAISHTLTGNTATLSGGTWTFISQVVGAYSKGAINGVTASNNKVEITGGTVTSPIFTVYGVYITGLETPTNDTQDVVAQNNEVVLKGNVPVSTVAGAYATGADLSKTNLTLTDNKVTISDEAKLDGANVYGALVPTTKLATVLSADIFSGNTLVVDNYTGTSKLAKIANFEKFKFVLPESYEVNKSVALQTVNLSLVSPTNSKQQARVESVSLLGEPRVLKAGDHVNLINADNPITGELANKDQRLVVNQGVTVRTSTLVRQETNQIYLEVEDTPLMMMV